MPNCLQRYKKYLIYANVLTFLRDLLLPVCARANISVADKNGQLIAKSDAKIMQQSAISCRMLKKMKNICIFQKKVVSLYVKTIIIHANRVT